MCWSGFCSPTFVHVGGDPVVYPHLTGTEMAHIVRWLPVTRRLNGINGKNRTGFSWNRHLIFNIFVPHGTFSLHVRLSGCQQLIKLNISQMLNECTSSMVIINLFLHSARAISSLPVVFSVVGLFRLALLTVLSVFGGEKVHLVC